MMSSYKHLGSYTKSKGVIVLYNKNKTKIYDVSKIQGGMLLSFQMKINNNYIRVLGFYVPSDSDEPEFFYKYNNVLHQAKEKGLLIILKKMMKNSSPVSSTVWIKCKKLQF